ncbi:proton pump-interactor 1 [Capsicum annuum]|uniref:proton pump-interactor 1 n=1 Tax=Capsicum annuum TaxID=4072 RepID=UPI0007BF40F4|nr:proton pump-interactor 1 [Capsicum annuum]XP_016581208.1 proton pump-interactor 1 [Capsicum annuum]XP_016581209.1 proton pump-interactor 1 [Capsicum annuum]XP_047271547.1 proton pump-interactor 1 [Capsicum annuum]XP_047271548.1 proton pump-interactor 1 [Capsicum annuum]
MGIEVESKLVHVPVEAGSEQSNLLNENGKPNHGSGITEPIKFGTHGTEEPKEDASRIPVSNVPKDAVEDWPEPKQVHSFYTVKFRRFEDPKVKAKIELAEKELQKKNQARSQIIEKLKVKRGEKSNLIEQRKALSAENKEFWSAIDGKRKEMEPLHEALGQLRGSKNAGRERGPMVCSSEEELNQLIKSLHYRIQHESIPLNEEKQILREIKQLEGTREDVKKVAATRAQIHETIGEKESIQNQVKLMNVGLDGVRKGQQEVKAKLKVIDDQIEAINKQINKLDEELKEVVEKRDKTYEHILELRKQREEGNSSFYQNSNLLHKLKQLADQKDVGALKELTVTEVDKFISLWCGSKSFRDDYERRILQSLDIRQLSRDGRMRNPDEKPLVLPEAPTVSRAEVVPAKANAKPTKEDHAPVDAAPIQKEQLEKSGKQLNDSRGKNTQKKGVVDDEEEIYGLDMPKDIKPKKNEVDEATLKEMKKEEEIAKNKQAMERKRKLAEKAAAKAAKKAQLEAEKKLKEREKRVRKKGGFSVQEPTEEPTEASEEVAEEENVEEKVETTVAPKVKARKENTIRHRVTRARGSELPKAVPKRRKATNYWLWAGAPAALVILVLLVVGYMYLQK